jgi:hypothetical protein
MNDQETIQILSTVRIALTEKRWLEALEKAAALGARCEASADPDIQNMAVKASLLSAEALAGLGQKEEALARYLSLQGLKLEPETQAELTFYTTVLQYKATDSSEALAQMLALSEQVHVTSTLELRRWQARAAAQWARWQWVNLEFYQTGITTQPDALISHCHSVYNRFQAEIDGDISLCVNHCFDVHVQVLQFFERPDYENQVKGLLALQWARYAQHADSRVQAVVLRAQLNLIKQVDEQSEQQKSLNKLLTQFDKNDDVVMQPLLLRMHRYSAEISARQSPPRIEEALTILARAAKRFEGSQDTEVQRQVWRIIEEQTQQLRKLDRWREALEILQTLPRNVNAWSRRLDIWQEQLPTALQSEGELQEIAEQPWTEAETQHAQIVMQFADTFADDKSEFAHQAVADALYDLAHSQRQRRHLEAAVSTYRRLIETYAGNDGLAQVIVSSYLNLGFLLFKLLNKPQDALVVYNELFARFKHSLNPHLRDSLAKASASRTHCIGMLREAGHEVSYGAQYETVTSEQVKAIQVKRKLALAHGENGRGAEAIALFDEVLLQYDQSIHPDLRMRCCDFLLLKAIQLSKLQNRADSLAAYELLINRYGDELDTTVQKDVALALANKARHLDKLGRTEDELAIYDEIIKRYASSQVPYMQERVVKAQFNKAVTLVEAGDNAKIEIAKNLYRSISAKWLTNGPTPCRLEAIKASNNLALLLRTDTQYAAAIGLYESVVHNFGNTGDDALREQCIVSRTGLARSLGKVGRLQEQKECYRTLLALPQSDLTLSLRAKLKKELQDIELLSVGSQLLGSFKNLFTKTK